MTQDTFVDGTYVFIGLDVKSITVMFILVSVFIVAKFLHSQQDIEILLLEIKCL